jgi:hypothetical protein
MSKLTKEQIKTAKELLAQHKEKAVYVIIDGVHMYFDKNNALQGVKDESEIEIVFASEEAQAEYEAEQAGAEAKKEVAKAAKATAKKAKEENKESKETKQEGKAEETNPAEGGEAAADQK